MAGENINRRINIYINGKEVVNSLSGVTREMAKTKNEMKNLNKGAADYDERLKKLKDTYEKLSQEQVKFRNEISKTPSLLQKIKSSLGPVATGMLAAFSIEAIASKFISKITDAWKTVVEFDQKQANLAATMQKSRTQIAGLTIDAIKIGSSTAYSASGVSDLQLELAKLGKTAPEIKAMTKDVLNAATALETDLASAATLVGGQLNSYGENADKAAKYSDIMANSVNISATSYDYLATALPKTSAVAALNNVTFERLNATMGVLANQNVQAETAGTGFRNILLESSKAGKPYQEMLDQVKNSADQGKTAVELFGKENATVAVILANSTDEIKSQTQALENSAGSAEKLAKEKMNSIKGAYESFSGAWEGFILSIEQGDGVISRMIIGMANWGASVLNLLTPMAKLSDSIKEEQLGLNVLVSKITSTNLSNEDRKKLLIDLKSQYPDFIKNIDTETVSNDDLNKALNRVNEQYVKRIALQKQVEAVEEKANDSAGVLQKRLELQEALFQKLNKIKLERKLKVNIDFGDLEKSSKRVMAELDKIGASKGAFSDFTAIQTRVSELKAWEKANKSVNNELNEQTEILNRQKKALGINTEAENENIKAKEEAAAVLKKLREEALKLGMKNAMTSSEEELKIWMNAYREKQKYSGEMSEEEKKKRQKQIEDAKKHSEDLLKDEEDLQKRLRETKLTADELILGLIRDDYERERALINTEYDKKIEDAKANALREQQEIDKLKTSLSGKGLSNEDRTSYQRQLDDRIEIQKNYNTQAISLEQTRNIKIGTLQEKYINEAFQKEQERAARELQNLKTKQNLELAGITTLAQAKEILSETLSAEDLSKITTLEDAKTEIKKKQLNEQYDLELKNLDKRIALYESQLNEGFTANFLNLSPEEREAILKFLDDVKAKRSEIILNKSSNNDNGKPKDKQNTGIDVLGYDSAQWENAFANLDTFEGKLNAISMVAGALQNAFSTYFKFLEASENRQMRDYERNNNKKKKFLADQLEKGLISQEVYNAKIAKLDSDVARKKAELEYKQAKRQKAMAIVDAVVKTAVGIMNAYASLDPISASIAAALIGALGALQIATIAKQPLPSKDGFKEGGYTGDGPNTGVAGDAHFKEYVIPENVLFSNDPVVPNIVGYLESKRQGRTPQLKSADTATEQSSTSFQVPATASDGKMLNVLSRLSDILDKIEKYGIKAWLSNDLRTAKNIRESIKEYEDLKNQAKQ